MALIGICVIMLMTCYSFHYVWSSDKAEVGSKMKTATAPTATDVEAVK